MPDCEYCGEPFDDETAHLRHLRDAHKGELGAIDRRRVADLDGGVTGELLLAVGALAVIGAVVYVAVLGGGGGGIESQPLPESGDEDRLAGVERFPSEGRTHVADGTEIDYGTSPPTSGPHYQRPARADFYAETPALGHLVHSLEHGAVVVYYDPAAATAAANESLRAWAGQHTDPWASVIVAPNPAAEPRSPYVLTAWRTMLRMDGYDAAVVRAFLAEYLGRGPENPVR